MKLFPHLKIAQKLPLVVVGAAFLASASVGIGSYMISAGTVTALTEEKLTTLAVERARELGAFFSAIKDDLIVTASSNTTVTSLGNLVMGWDQMGEGQTATLQKAFITDNPNPPGERSLLDAARLNAGITYDMAHGRLNPAFRGQLQTRGYGDIYLIDLKGNVLYSVNKELDYAANVADGGSIAETPLGEVYRTAMAMTEPGGVAFADVSPYSVTPGVPASFMATPIFSGAQLVGVLVFKMPVGRIDSIMNARTGLGQTGETFFVGTDYLLRNESPFTESGDVLATRYSGPAVDTALGGQQTHAARVSEPGMPDRLAVAVPVSFADTKWALVATIGEAEAMAPVTDMRNMILGIGGLVLALAAASGFVFSRSITRPMTRLTGTMQALADGDLEAKVSGGERTDEFGAMARALEVFRASGQRVQQMTEEEQLNSAARRADRAQMMQALQRSFGQVVDAAVAGDFTRRVDANFADAELNALARSVNRLVETVERGLAETGRVLAALAETDLTLRMEGGYEGDFARLQRDTNAVADRLTEIVGHLKQTAGSLKLATGEILSGANDLSQRTTKQAATIEETSAAMEQLAATVVENAQRAEAASAKAKVVSQTALEGGEVISLANNAMERITQSSGKISNIIGMIDDIAFQTNLLALNASVEAARAGDAGKGFAVVAVEVRRLAQSAASASSEVKALIEQSAAEVRTGSKLVADAAGKLASMQGAVQENASLIGGIASASTQQASAIAEVSAAVRLMDEMTQHNAALVEETNAAIEQTEAQASELDRIVDVFTLDGEAVETVRRRAA